MIEVGSEVLYTKTGCIYKVTHIRKDGLVTMESLFERYLGIPQEELVLL